MHFPSKDCISSVSSPASVCVLLSCKKWLLIHGVVQKNVIREKIGPDLDRQGPRALNLIGSNTRGKSFRLSPSLGLSRRRKYEVVPFSIFEV